MRRTSPKALTALLSVAVLALLVTTIVVLVGWRPPIATGSPEARNLERELEEVSPEVVVLGNSIAGAGIDEERLAARLGMRVAILSVPRSRMPVWYAVLKNRVFGNGYRPKLILIPATLYDMLHVDLQERHDVVRLTNQLGHHEPVIDAKVMGRSGSAFWGRRWAKQEEIRRRLTYVAPNMAMGLILPAEEGDAASPLVRGARVVERSLGRVFHESKVDFTIQAPPDRFQPPDASTVSDLPPADEGLVGDMVELAHANGAAIVFIRIPVAPGNESADPVTITQERDLVSLLNRTQAGYLDLWHMDLRPTDFQDPYHLDATGKGRVTKALGNVLMQWSIGGGFEIPPAAKPRSLPTVTREGEPPRAIRLRDRPNQTAAAPCEMEAKLPIISDFAEPARTGATPFVVYQEEEPLNHRPLDESTCEPGQFALDGEWVRFTPFENVKHDFSLRVVHDREISQPISGRAVHWVYPGTTLRYAFDEPWQPEDGPFMVEVHARPFGRGKGQAEVRVQGRGAVAFKGHGGRLVSRMQRRKPEGPWWLEIESPPNGPFLAVMGLALGDEAHRAMVVAIRYKALTPMVHIVGRPPRETSSRWIGAPPVLPPELEKPPLLRAAGGAGMFKLPLLAHLADTNTGRCSPVVVYEDGKLLRRRHTFCAHVAKRAATMCHAKNSILFNATDGSDPVTNGRTYTLGLKRPSGKFCSTELWMFPGDTLRVRLEDDLFRDLFSGANVLELSGLIQTPDGGPARSLLDVELQVDGVRRVHRKVQADAIAYGVGFVPVEPPVPPTTQSVLLELGLPEDGPFVLLRNAILTEMSPEEQRKAGARYERWTRWRRKQAQN